MRRFAWTTARQSKGEYVFDDEDRSEPSPPDSHLGSVWRATWGRAMESLLFFVEPLTLVEHDGYLSDSECWTPTADAAWADRWTGWGYRWNGGVVLTGVRLDEGEHLGLVVQAVDRRGRPDLRLDEIGDGWARDERAWLAYHTGIPVRSSGAELEPLRVAAINMAAQIAWVSGRSSWWRRIVPAFSLFPAR
jgi:hypothetical protein